MTIPCHGLVAPGRALACALFLSNYVCSSQAEIKPEAFHRTIDGSQVDLYTLNNSNGLERSARRSQGIRQGGLASRESRDQRRTGPQVDVHEQRWRRRLSRHPQLYRYLHSDEQERVEDRVRRRDG